MADDRIVNFPSRDQPAKGGDEGIDPNAPPMPEIGNLGFEDLEAAFNMRGWLQRACEAAGGKMVGGGFGCGVADLEIELDGCRFNVTIRPRG